MNTYNHLYKNRKQLESFLDGIELDREIPMLVRIHSCVHSAKGISALSSEIRHILPNARIIGCSTPGVIYDGKIINDACLISISTFESSETETFFTEWYDANGALKSVKAVCAELSEKLIRGRKGFLLVFLPPLFGNGINFIERMNEMNPDVKILGGGAGTKQDYSDDRDISSYVLIDSITSNTGLAAAFITSDKLQVYESYICGAESVGKSYEITKSHKHYLGLVEGRNGADWYAELLGKSELDKNPKLSNMFPLIRETDIRMPFYVDYESRNGGRVNLYCEFPKKTRISLGYFSPQKTLEEMKAVFDEVKVQPAESIFAYDCQTRELLLHNCAKWEVGQFFTTNTSGALLSGEIVHSGGKNIYANFTFVLACLSENEKTRIHLRGRDLRNVSALQQDNVNIVNYLLASSNRRLNEQLESQQSIIKKSMFYNEMLGLNNQLSYLYDRESMEFNKIALYSLTNERMVKLFVGQIEIFEELKAIYKSVSERLAAGKNAIRIYSYETSSLLLAADSSVSMAAFEKTAKEVLEYLNGIALNDVQLSYRCVTVENEQKPLRKAEKSMQYGSDHGLTYINYSRMMQEIPDATEEVHMLQVIREALAEERVVPYFQGIYDNEQKQFGLYESLIRIQDRNGKIYYPNQFLPIAKEYNLYESLSVIMVKKVMGMFLDKDTRVTINLNVRDVYDHEMIRVIFSNLGKAKNPENFVFELVEAEEITDYSYIMQFAERIHEKGAKIAIDDFGSGYSNLMHIIRIDADYLKIDGEIIRAVCEDNKCKEFIGIINVWCGTQNKKVIAEFVENEEIQSILEQMGVAYSQGYYFSKPSPWEDTKIHIS